MTIQVVDDPGHWTDHIAGVVPGDRIAAVATYIDLGEGIIEIEFCDGQRVVGACRVPDGPRHRGPG